MISSILKGIWSTLKNPKLVLLLWIWNLLLAVAAAWPARAWFRTALDTRVETESLLTRFNIGTFADMNKYSDVTPFTFLMASMAGAALVALVGNAFMNGGILEVMGSEHESQTFMQRFYRGGGHFFWRFVRLNAMAFISGAVVVGIAAAAMGAVATPLSDSEWEPAGIVWGIVTLAVSGLVALWFVLALDYGRIRVAREGHRGMMRVYLSALGFIRHHVLATYGIAILALAGTGALLLGYVAHETVWSASTWAAIAVLAGVQQIVMLARTGLRVMQVGAEWHYFAAVAPAAAAGPATSFSRPVCPPTRRSSRSRGPGPGGRHGGCQRHRHDGTRNGNHGSVTRLTSTTMIELWTPLPTSTLGLATTAHAVLGVLRKHRSRSESFPWLVLPAIALAASPWVFSDAVGVAAGLLLHLLWFAVCEIFSSRHRIDGGKKPSRDVNEHGRFLPLPVLSVTDVSPTIRTFRMARPASFAFRAGQFLTVRAHVDGTAHVRCYSISSAPESADYIEISVKRQGLVSGALHVSVRRGSHLFVRPPAGRFTYPVDDDGPIVLVAGGVGITPMISMAKHAVAAEPGRSVTLLYSTRGAQELAFWNELCDLAAAHHQFKVVATLTAAEANWSGRVGRIGEKMITECVAEPSRAVFLICGPTEMIAEMRRTLERLGVPADRVRSEVFQPSAAIGARPHAGAAVQGSAGEIRRVTFARSRQVVAVDAGQALLDAADGVRIPIPCLCRAGVCGTCRTRVISGEVDCTSDALDAADRASGWTLPCVAFAKTDCSLEA